MRDLLMGIEPHDVDFATTVKPDKMKEIFAENEVRVIDYGSRATEHGTVLVRINDKVSPKLYLPDYPSAISD